MPMIWHTSKNNAIYNIEIQSLSKNLFKMKLNIKNMKQNMKYENMKQK